MSNFVPASSFIDESMQSMPVKSDVNDFVFTWDEIMEIENEIDRTITPRPQKNFDATNPKHIEEQEKTRKEEKDTLMKKFYYEFQKEVDKFWAKHNYHSIKCSLGEAKNYIETKRPYLLESDWDKIVQDFNKKTCLMNNDELRYVLSKMYLFSPSTTIKNVSDFDTLTFNKSQKEAEILSLISEKKKNNQPPFLTQDEIDIIEKKYSHQNDKKCFFVNVTSFENIIDFDKFEDFVLA
jgi:hypothetical protein